MLSRCTVHHLSTVQVDTAWLPVDVSKLSIGLSFFTVFILLLGLPLSFGGHGLGNSLGLGLGVATVGESRTKVLSRVSPDSGSD